MSNVEKQARVLHLGDLMNLATVYQWEAVLEFHGACLLALERDIIQWGDSFARLESVSIAGRFLTRSSSPTKASANRGKLRAGVSVDSSVYCAAFNRGVCTLQESHDGEFRGRAVKLLHVCSACLRYKGKQETHVSGSETCPLLASASTS